MNHHKPRAFPQSVQSERAILGIILQRGDLLDEVMTQVAPEDFHRPDHAALYVLMLEMREDNHPIDISTVAERVATEGDDKYGGLAHVISHVDHAPSVANWPYYCSIVRKTKIARDAIDAHHRAIDRLYERGDAMEHLQAGIDELSALADAGQRTKSAIITMREAKRRAYAQLYDGKPDAIRFPIRALQQRIRRMMPGSLTVIGATPGSGKTAIAMQIVRENGADGAVCGQIPLEMTSEGLAMRDMSASSGVSLTALTRRLSDGGDADLSERDWSRLDRDIDETSDRLYLLDTSARNLSQIRGYARQMHRRALREHGRGLDLLVIDYAQMISVDGSQSLFERIEAISYGLVEVAQELRCHVLLLSQLTRDGEIAEQKGEPMHRRFLFGGGGMNNAADNTILLCKTSSGRREFYVEKARWGVDGGPPTVLDFDGDHQRFLDGETRAALTAVDADDSGIDWDDMGDLPPEPPKPRPADPPRGASGLPDYSGGKNFDAVAARGVERAAQRDEDLDNVRSLDDARRQRDDPKLF